MSRELVLTTLQCHTPQDLLELRNNKKCQKDRCKKNMIFNRFPTSIKGITKIRHKRRIEAEQRRHGGDLGQRMPGSSFEADPAYIMWFVGGAPEEMLVWQHPANGTRSCLT